MKEKKKKNSKKHITLMGNDKKNQI